MRETGISIGPNLIPRCSQSSYTTFCNSGVKFEGRVHAIEQGDDICVAECSSRWRILMERIETEMLQVYFEEKGMSTPCANQCREEAYSELPSHRLF